MFIYIKPSSVDCYIKKRNNTQGHNPIQRYKVSVLDRNDHKPLDWEQFPLLENLWAIVIYLWVLDARGGAASSELWWCPLNVAPRGFPA